MAILSASFLLVLALASPWLVRLWDRLKREKTPGVEPVTQTFSVEPLDLTFASVVKEHRKAEVSFPPRLLDLVLIDPRFKELYEQKRDDIKPKAGANNDRVEDLIEKLLSDGDFVSLVLGNDPPPSILPPAYQTGLEGSELPGRSEAGVEKKITIGEQAKAHAQGVFHRYVLESVVALPEFNCLLEEYSQRWPQWYGHLWKLAHSVASKGAGKLPSSPAPDKSTQALVLLIAALIGAHTVEHVAGNGSTDKEWVTEMQKSNQGWLSEYQKSNQAWMAEVQKSNQEREAKEDLLIADWEKSNEVWTENEQKSEKEWMEKFTESFTELTSKILEELEKSKCTCCQSNSCPAIPSVTKYFLENPPQPPQTGGSSSFVINTPTGSTADPSGNKSSASGFQITQTNNNLPDPSSRTQVPNSLPPGSEVLAEFQPGMTSRDVVIDYDKGNSQRRFKIGLVAQPPPGEETWYPLPIRLCAKETTAIIDSPGPDKKGALPGTQAFSASCGVDGGNANGFLVFAGKTPLYNAPLNAMVSVEERSNRFPLFWHRPTIVLHIKPV